MSGERITDQFDDEPQEPATRNIDVLKVNSQAYEDLNDMRKELGLDDVSSPTLTRSSTLDKAQAREQVARNLNELREQRDKAETDVRRGRSRFGSPASRAEDLSGDAAILCREYLSSIGRSIFGCLRQSSPATKHIQIGERAVTD